MIVMISMSFKVSGIRNVGVACANPHHSGLPLSELMEDSHGVLIGYVKLQTA